MFNGKKTVIRETQESQTLTFNSTDYELRFIL